MRSKNDHAAVPRLRPIALGVAIAAVLPIAAQAAVIEIYAESTYSMGGGTATTLKDPSSGTRTSGYVDVLEFTSSGSNSIGLHSYGSDAGDFGSRSSGAGIYDVNGLFRIREQITNTSASAAAASFNFNITPGILSNDIRTAFGSGDFVAAAISFEIVAKRGSDPANTVWSSSASLVSNETALGQFTASGDDTGFYVPQSYPWGPGIYYDVQGFAKSLDLGTLAAGETLELSYEIKTSAKGQSTAGGSITVPGREVTIPGHWVWGGVDWASEGPPGNAINGVCEPRGEARMAFAAGYGGEIGDVGDPGNPPTDSVCWHYVAEHTEWLDGYTYPENTDPNGSQASSGDPSTLELGDPTWNWPGYFTGFLPLQGGLQLTQLPPGTNVPEPGILTLLGLGLVGGCLARRRSV